MMTKRKTPFVDRTIRLPIKRLCLYFSDTDNGWWADFPFYLKILAHIDQKHMQSFLTKNTGATAAAKPAFIVSSSAFFAVK